jgi:hypothetical protein
MAQNALILRGLQTRPLPINVIDGNLTYLQDVALASSNSLQYVLAATYTPYPSVATLPFAYPTYYQEWFIRDLNVVAGVQTKFRFNAVIPFASLGKETRNAVNHMVWASNGFGIKIGLGEILAQIDTDSGVFLCIGCWLHLLFPYIYLILIS